MKKKNGFTLIELLAVIVILAIIALIAVPVILNIIDKANKSAFKDTAYGIVNAAELYFAEQQLDLNGMTEEIEFTLPSQANITDGLQIKGEVPEGRVQINKDGEIALLVKNERYCITKGYNETDVTLSEDLEHCYMPHTLAALSVEEVECATDKTEGACEPGTLFTIKVNDTDTKNFYVIEDAGNKVTLIMHEILGGYVEWISSGDYAIENNKDETPDICATAACTDEGPITAINHLDEKTDDEWSNIPKKTYTYSGIGQYNDVRIYEDIIRTMRVRMITYPEVSAVSIGCQHADKSCPNWISSSGEPAHWSSTASYNDPNVAVDMGYRRLYYGSVSSPHMVGVRPVIELSK